MKELYEKYRNYLPFAFVCLCFVIIVSFTIYGYYKNGQDLELEEDANVEVSLPLIEWNKYENLSKKQK